MKKSLCLVLLFMISVMMLAGCGPTSNPDVEAWSAKDFAFYNASGEEEELLTTISQSMHLKDFSDLRTYRGVKIGDKATTALAKYDIPYGYAVYSISSDMDSDITYTSDINLDGVFKQAARDGDTVWFGIALNPKFKPIKAAKDLKHVSYWYLLFYIEDEEIINIGVSKHI